MICNNIPEEKRKYLDKKCTEEELNSIRLISTKISCSRQAVHPSNISEDCTERQAELFVKGAIKAQSEAMFLENNWWQSMTAKYKLPEKTYLDFKDGSFYTVKE
jgi:hypothetical protein